MSKFAKYTEEELRKECEALEKLNETLQMRLVAIKAIVSNTQPLCAEKLKQALFGCNLE